MKIGSAFPNKYLKAADLNGNAVTVTINAVKVEDIGRDKDEKPVLYFKGKDKGLVLNKTNSRTIQKIAGTDETDEWRGVEIVLYPTETEFSGEMVDCIRVRAPKTQPQREATRKLAPPKGYEEPQETEETLRDDFVASDDDVPFSLLLPILLPLLTLGSLLV